MKLTDTVCKNAKPAQKAKKLFDGGGLYLEVMPKGAKYWRLKYRIHGKEKRFALGVYPSVTLKEARDKRESAKKLIAEGVDPSQQKQMDKITAQRNAENTFQAVAMEWFDINQSSWSPKHAQKMMQRLERNVFPALGNRPIKDITPPELLQVLRKMESRGAYDMAGRVKQTCGRIFRFGIQTGKCEWDVAQNLSGALKTHKTEHWISKSFRLS